MPYSEYTPNSPNTTQYQPGTTNPVTHSFSERLLTAEFDDALCDQAAWKNSRYDGAKLISKKINEYTPEISPGIGSASIQNGLDLNTGTFQIGPVDGTGGYVEWAGDVTYQNQPVIEKQTTALYIANTVVGGTEDPQFATLRGHSYVGINKILLIDPVDDSVQIIDRAIEPYEEFHSFITNDFSTGTRANLKIIDESIATNLKSNHRIRMNKGYLIKSFKFDEAGEFTGSAAHSNDANADVCLTENNSIYLYKSGSVQDDYIKTGSMGTTASRGLPNQLRFRYGTIEMIPAAHDATSTGWNPGGIFPLDGGTGTFPNGVDVGHRFDMRRVGPLFTSASIFQNKFTEQYYTGSYGFIKHQVQNDLNKSTFAKRLAASSLGSASKFLGIDTLNFLASNNASNNLTEQEKTELHITFFEGAKDFAPGKHDERSIGTFEVDQNKAQLGIELGDQCNNGLPTTHELVFKGPNDGRFMPTIPTFVDTLINARLESTASSGVLGCAATASGIQFSPGGEISANGFAIQKGVTIDRSLNAEIFIQGGALGNVGFIGANSGSMVVNAGGSTFYLSNWSGGPSYSGGTYGLPITGSMSGHNYYSGSFNYEVSFLDKDHTLIMDLDKDQELFNGIGDKGLLLIPNNALPIVKNNIEYYLNKAGIIDNTTNTQQNVI
jgi:hypothetical protein